MLNRLSRKLRSRFQGIPPIAAHIYKFLAVRVISKLHELVDKEGKPVGMLSIRDLVEAIVTLLSVPME